MLGRPPEQISEEIIRAFAVDIPRLHSDDLSQDTADIQIDVSNDLRRSRGFRHTVIPGTRLSLFVPYEGPREALLMRASTYTVNPPIATLGDGELVLSRDLPADVVTNQGEAAFEAMKRDVAQIEEFLGHATSEIRASNQQLETEVRSAVQRRREKVLADRNLQAAIGVPLRRYKEVAASYVVQPIERRRPPSVTARPTTEPFAAEPTISDSDFRNVVGDLVNITRSFERLAVTYVDQHEERLRDQILTMLGNTYGNPTGETFSKHGKTDIYLPWENGAVFLAECKWWTGPKNFEEEALPQLLDRYVVWRDTHAAMILFIRNKDVSAVIDKAVEARRHPRYLRDADPIGDVPVFVLHKDGDPNKEIQLALITAAIVP